MQGIDSSENKLYIYSPLFYGKKRKQYTMEEKENFQWADVGTEIDICKNENENINTTYKNKFVHD